MRDLRLSEIWIYPIKSMGGIRLEKARVLPKGLEHDRRWMLVDEKNRFITQREHSKLALFQLAIKNEQLSIHHRTNLDSIHFGMNIHEKAFDSVTIWNDQVQALEVDQNVSRWFSDQLKMKCRLMYFPESNSRPVDPAYAIQNDQVSFADGYPFLILGQASLDDLNSRLENPVPMNRFRPNLVFTGGQPYEEDQWREFSIGNNRFMGVKNCSRCVLPTVNQETGLKGDEPLRTLSTYRKRNNNIFFGQNAVALDDGILMEGNVIT